MWVQNKITHWYLLGVEQWKKTFAAVPIHQTLMMGHIDANMHHSCRLLASLKYAFVTGNIPHFAFFVCFLNAIRLFFMPLFLVLVLQALHLFKPPSTMSLDHRLCWFFPPRRNIWEVYLHALFATSFHSGSDSCLPRKVRQLSMKMLAVQYILSVQVFSCTDELIFSATAR